MTVTVSYFGVVGPPTEIRRNRRGKNALRSISKGQDVAWGKNEPGAPITIKDGHVTNAAFLILMDALDNETRAKHLMQRFKHRVLFDKKAGQPFSITMDEVMATVSDIERVERDTAQSRTMIAQEPGPVVSERVPDGGWTKTPKIIRNDPNDRS